MKSAPFDRLWPLLRHLILLLLPVLLGWASADLLPFLQDRFPQWALIWAAVTQAVLWATPLTRQYGAGARQADGGGGDHAA